MNNNPDPDKMPAGSTASFTRFIPWGMALFTLMVTGVYLSRQFYDPDFYWHLKTGQWIWQNMSLPPLDPFGVPPLPDPSPRSEFILTSYWLNQLVLYAFYSLAGMPGIAVYRWVIAGVCLLICVFWTNVRNTGVTAVIALGTILILEFYFIERPQFVSFVCFGALLVLLFRFCEQPARRPLGGTLVPLALVMAVWANMHGGFLIGQAILAYYVIAEGIKFLHPSLEPLPVRDYRTLLVSSIAALLASCLNPNAINLFEYMPVIFDADNYANANNLEQLSLVGFFRVSRDYTVLLYGVSMALTAVALLASRQRRNITWVGILAGTAFAGCQHMRLMPFFLVSAMIFMTRYMETECSALKGRLVLISMLAVTTLYCVSDEIPHIADVTRSGWVPGNQFPVQAADFIARNDIRGNIYTTMDWGGYMVWRAGPENRVFYDGRILSIQRAWEYNNSRIIAMNQRPYWKGLMNVYSIQAVLVPIYDGSGLPDPMTRSISADREWTMVFSAGNEAVFVRSGQPPL